MCSINFICSVYTSWRNHSDRELALLHNSCLNRGSLCTEYYLIINVECILFILSRVVSWYVKCLKVVVIILNFWSINYFIEKNPKIELSALPYEMAPVTATKD